MNAGIPTVALFASLLTLGVAATASAPPDAASAGGRTDGISDLEQARADYIENCGGCHGIEGSTAPAQVPELRGRVGYFMCTASARAYLLRLPNVAHNRLQDTERVADVMNYIVFHIGQDSAPRGTTPFTPQEVARERKLALTAASLIRERAREVENVVRACGAPANLSAMYASKPARR